MKREKCALIAALILLLLSFAVSVILQKTGYLPYLNSDMASETILANRQYRTHSLVQMDWIYSTEIHSIHMNLLYAIAFLFTDQYAVARIIGNTIGFALAALSFCYLGKKLHFRGWQSLLLSCMLPVAASAVYAQNFTIGGYYIIHLPLAYLLAALWLDATENGKRPLIYIIFLLVCMLEGFLSVRYVLCFICPLMFCALLHFASKENGMMPDLFERKTTLGFAACVAGYAASEFITPRLFSSGVGAADSFLFRPLNGQEILSTLLTVGTDFLKVMGWHEGVKLFSMAGLLNLSIIGILLLGSMMLFGVLKKRESLSANERNMIFLALSAFAINLVVFLSLSGTYLNRYLIVALIYFVPLLGVLLRNESRKNLVGILVLLLVFQMGTGSILLFKETKVQEKDALDSDYLVTDVIDFLTGEGYQHGYGSYWHARVMEERASGKITFTGVRIEKTEDGAVTPVAPEFIRWLEPEDASSLDIYPSNTFYLVTKEEEIQLKPWLTFTQAPLLFQNDLFSVYGFNSSTAFCNAMLIGKMKLTDASVQDLEYTVEPGGRMRIPTSWREKGHYVLYIHCLKTPDTGACVKSFVTSHFELLSEKELHAGDNQLAIDVSHDDKYFMLLIENKGNTPLIIRNMHLVKE